MSYISRDGTISSNRPSWKLSIVPEFFWRITNVVVLFFQTMFQPDLNRRGRGYESSYSARASGQNPPGPPRRRMGGFNNTLDCSSAPMGGG